MTRYWQDMPHSARAREYGPRIIREEKRRDPLTSPLRPWLSVIRLATGPVMEVAAGKEKSSLPKILYLGEGKEVQIVELPDESPAQDAGGTHQLEVTPYKAMRSQLESLIPPRDPEEMRRLASIIINERYFPLNENLEYDVRENPQPTLEEGETSNER